MIKLWNRIVDYFYPSYAKDVEDPIFFKDHCLWEMTDGFNSYKELYEHRNQLWITLCKCFNSDYVWRSKKHYDNSYYKGWFLLGYRTKPGKQIFYYLPEELWEQCDFAKTRARAPRFDGHSAAQQLDRLKNLK